MANEDTSVPSVIKRFGTIVGAPHQYRASADPGGRAFARHMLVSPPLVMIRPGRAVFTQGEKLKEAMTALLGEDAAKQQFERIGGGDGGIYSETVKYGVQGIDRANYDALLGKVREKERGTVSDALTELDDNIRYCEFDQRVGDYLSTVMTLSSRLFARLSNIDNADMAWAPWDTAEQISTGQGGFFTFWADNATSVSESASSEYGSSMLQDMMNKLNGLSKEAQFIWGGQQMPSLIDAAAGAVQSEDPNGVRSSLSASIRGEQPMLPNMWKGSSFSRSYNLSFKFFSPYGTPQAVYQNVLLPFSMLLSLALPMARSPGTFGEPFVFQLDCPGYFACDLGLCTSFSFTKGGTENLWTVDGLPRQIDVTMQVEDLYPSLMASHNIGSMNTNIGLMTFLDNLAGVNLSKSGDNTDLITQLKANMYKAVTSPLTEYQGAKAFFQDAFNRSLGRIFR